MSVSCSVKGGKPLPTLTLTCNGTNQSSTSTGKVVTALSIPATRGLNGKACTYSGIQANTQWSETKDSGTFDIKCKIALC